MQKSRLDTKMGTDFREGRVDLHIDVGNCSFPVEDSRQLVPKGHVVSAALESFEFTEENQPVTSC